jgi:glycosyltransferase involved in cell wall biosynthesis
VFKAPRTVDYRASIHDIGKYLLQLMRDPDLRKCMGEAGRSRVVDHYDYRVVAKRFLQLLSEQLELT